MQQKLSEFYDGKSIFITGAAGFLGTVILETLLRCFPGIACVFVLLRQKKGVSPQSRKSIILNKQIFTRWQEDHQNLQTKVCVVSGDICLPNLGLNDEDYCKIIENVSIVFHSAADTNFGKPLRNTCLVNAKGTYNVIDLCKKINKLEAFVYTSTAYSNAHCFPNIIEEKVYDFPCEIQSVLDELERGTEDSLEALVSEARKKWPNNYTFSKCLAEALLKKFAAHLPVVIIRPSIIGGAAMGPKAGYFEEGSGLGTVMILIGKGFAKLLRGRKDSLFDYIPVDIVANAHVSAAWTIVNKRKSSPFVINCTSGDVLKLTFAHFVEEVYTMHMVHPLPREFQIAHYRILNNKFLYDMLALYEHYLPAALLDLVSRLKGSKFRLMKLYRFYDTLMQELYFFTSTTLEFETKNFKSLSLHLLPEEQEIIYTDLKTGVTFRNLIEKFPTGCPYFDWKIDKYSPKKRKYISTRRSMLITFIKRTTLFFLLWLLYFTLSKVFL